LLKVVSSVERFAGSNAVQDFFKTSTDGRINLTELGNGYSTLKELLNHGGVAGLEKLKAMDNSWKTALPSNATPAQIRAHFGRVADAAGFLYRNGAQIAGMGADKGEVDLSDIYNMKDQNLLSDRALPPVPQQSRPAPTAPRTPRTPTTPPKKSIQEKIQDAGKEISKNIQEFKAVDQASGDSTMPNRQYGGETYTHRGVVRANDTVMHRYGSTSSDKTFLLDVDGKAWQNGKPITLQP
jgi:hypothetical protein